MDRILVLDGDARAALAVVRSLGRRGLEVGVAAPRRDALAARSRFAGPSWESPDPGLEPERYRRWLLGHVDAWRPHMVLPLTDLSLRLALGIEAPLRERSVLPCVDFETFRRVSDKAELLALAAELGLRTPETLRVAALPERAPELEAQVRGFPYPAVLKANVTQSERGAHFVRLPVAYPSDAAQALALLGDPAGFGGVDTLLQQRIEGPGCGVFALCADGEPVARFAHRRRLEKPPSGGVSVLSEGIPLERAPLREAERLLAQLRWQGIAMVEFKRHRDGAFYLMEINPRFWGSLQLAVDSGRDFPALLYQLFRSGEPLRGEKLERLRAELPPLRTGCRLRWLLGTVDHAVIRLRRERAGALWDLVFRNSLELLRAPSKTRLEVLRRSDPGPFAAELRAWLRALRAGTG